MFFKKKMLVTEIGIGLLHFLHSPEAIEQQLRKDFAIANEEVVQSELIYLRIFMVDYAIAFVFENNPVLKNAILTNFHESLQKKFEKESKDNFEEIKNSIVEHFSMYTVAVNTSHEKGPAWMVGKQFADFCDYEMDANAIFLGSLEFTLTVNTVSNFLKSLNKDYRIIC